MMQRVAAGLAPYDIQDDEIMLYFDVAKKPVITSKTNWSVVNLYI